MGALRAADEGGCEDQLQRWRAAASASGNVAGAAEVLADVCGHASAPGH